MQRKSSDLQLVVQEYLDVDWTSVKCYLRRQIAKCVKDCKSQASNARRIVKNVRHSQEISNEASLTNGTCESDYDDDSMEWDTDFEDDCEDDLKEENMLKEPNNNIVQEKSSEPDVPEKCLPAESNNSTSRSKYIPKPPDLPLITKMPATTGSSNYLIAIKEFESSAEQQQFVSMRNNPSRPPLKRPPSQPPPPPVPQTASQDEPQEDYEVPINPSAASSFSASETNTPSVVASPSPSISSCSTTELPSLPSKPSITDCSSFSSETYEIIETPEENYEMVDENKWTASAVPVLSDKPALPPRLPVSTCASPPPPPLPQKPRKLQENSHVQKSENFPSLPRPKLPVKNEDDATENSTASGNVGTAILNSLLGRKYSATPNSSPKLHHYVKEVGGSDPTILSSVSSVNDHLSRSSTPDKEVSVSHYKSLSTSMSSVIAELVKTTSPPPPPLPPRIPLATAEDIAQSMATRPLPPVPASAARTESDVPSKKEEAIHLQLWFHEIERQEAELLIRDLGQSGAFLVRPSKRAGKENPYTLTVLHDEKVFHLNIRERSDGMFALGKEKKKEKAFQNVTELISYHQTEPILLTSRGESAGQTILHISPSKHSG